MSFSNSLAQQNGVRKAKLTIASMTGGYSDVANTDDTDSDFTTTGGAADSEWQARKFVAVNTGKVMSAFPELGMTDGALAGTMVCCIYSDDGGGTSLPDTQIGNDSESITLTNLSADAGGAEQEFVWLDGPDVVAGAVYWLVMKTAGYTYTNGVDEVRWRTDANGAVGLNECAKYDSNGAPNWTTLGANVGADLRINTAANWEITADELSDAIPNEVAIAAVTLVPTVATIKQLRMYSRSTRLLADLEYDDPPGSDQPWYDGFVASVAPDIDGTRHEYKNLDGDNIIYGTILVRMGESASAFTLAIEFT